jgi:hypothetical protein
MASIAWSPARPMAHPCGSWPGSSTRCGYVGDAGMDRCVAVTLQRLRRASAHGA